jgi:4-hydroxy-tetrahydrodipicolinate synthase
MTMAVEAGLGGLAVALATPFGQDGRVDLQGFRRLVRHVVEGGADVLVPLGSTGEAATLEEDERDGLIEACLEESRGRPVLVGTGHNATARTAAWTARAQRLGAAAALVVTPYYNKPGLEGLCAHFQAVADAAPGLPLVVYNVPGRTGLNLSPEALARLWELPSVVAVKESSGNLARVTSRFSDPEIDQIQEPWVRAPGGWHSDDC